MTLSHLKASFLGLAALTFSFAPGASASTNTGQSIGFYSHGSLADPTSLPPEGPGFFHLFEKRDRQYGAQELIDLIRSAAERMSQLHPEGERLQIGDIAGRQGGAISGHASHQNGLDADIVFYRVNHQEQLTTESRATFTENFVTGDRVSPNLDLARNWELIRLLIASGRINRIFVHPAIKQAFCAYARSLGQLKASGEALRRLRPEKGHYDHMHVRFNCPESSTRCQPQADVGPGTGCP